jgi:hypothetical protein
MPELLCVSDIVNSYLIAEKRYLERGHSASFYPTDASMKIKINGYDTVIGKCLRESYFSMSGVKPTNPPGIRGQRIFKLGKLVEEAEINYYKETGIWYGNNVKFQDPEHKVSGEADCLIFNEEKDHRVEGVELKSGYGPYFSQKVANEPDPSHVLQVMLYIYYFDMPWHIVYIDRGEAFTAAEWILVKDKDDRILACPRMIATGPEKWVYSDQFKHLENYNIHEVWKRYKILGKHLALKSPPDPEFQFSYKREELERMNVAGLVSKTKFDRYTKAITTEKAVKQTKNKEAKGAVCDAAKAVATSWRCMYCSFKNHCWKDDPEFNDKSPRIIQGEVTQISV